MLLSLSKITVSTTTTTTSYTFEFFSEWINAHVEDTTELLQKPLVMTEFGKKMYTKDRKKEIIETRDPVYRTAYRIFLDNLKRYADDFVGEGGLRVVVFTQA